MLNLITVVVKLKEMEGRLSELEYLHNEDLHSYKHTTRVYIESEMARLEKRIREARTLAISILTGETE